MTLRNMGTAQAAGLARADRLLPLDCGMSTQATATGLVAASACHRTALAQREAVRGLLLGAPGTAATASMSLRKEALVSRREALLTLRSQACAGKEELPSLASIEAALAPLLASILERKPSGGADATERNGNVPPPPAAAPPPLLWEVSAALQGALLNEAQAPQPGAPAPATPTDRRGTPHC